MEEGRAETRQSMPWWHCISPNQALPETSIISEHFHVINHILPFCWASAPFLSVSTWHNTPENCQRTVGSILSSTIYTTDRNQTWPKLYNLIIDPSLFNSLSETLMQESDCKKWPYSSQNYQYHKKNLCPIPILIVFRWLEFIFVCWSRKRWPASFV